MCYFPVISAVVLPPLLLLMCCYVAPPTGHQEGDRLEERHKGLTEAAALALAPVENQLGKLKIKQKDSQSRTDREVPASLFLLVGRGKKVQCTRENPALFLSDSVFVQAVLNYLPVCLKDAQGNFDISSSEPTLKSFWPTKA